MATTPRKLFGVSKSTWFEYEALRRSGIMNMWGSKEALHLSNDEFSAIVQHYPEMSAAWKEAFEPLASAMTITVEGGVR